MNESSILGLFSDMFPSSRLGVAPYGVRYSETVQDPLSPKRLGYFGGLQSPEGMMTELSSSFDLNGQTIRHPLVVPTLTTEELLHLQSGGKPTESIYDKAQMWAIDRLKRGQDPFATTQDVRFPVPETNPMYRDPFADTTR